jgi:threonine aldolase
MAAKLATGIASGGYGLDAETETNQVFPVLPDTVIADLQQDFAFYVWGRSDDGHSVIRLVTSWATSEGQVDAFLSRLASQRHAPVRS